MYCLKCKEYREGFYCPECGSRLVENPIGTTGGLHLGDANAISGGIHYSETNNVSNNITNNTTNVYEAQKTELEIIQENETGFFDAVLLAVSNGTFGPKERAELERERIRRHVSPQRAEEIIASAGSRDSISSVMVASIAKSLSEYGYTAHSDVGSSDFKLDLAIVDPDNSLSYCLGIIIDGMNYYRLKTVRDREVVRPQILDRLGWKITRVWTIDWFLHPDRVMSQIMTELKSLKK